MATWPSPPPTRILSWRSLVQEADPSFQTLLNQPIQYEFSSGRCFVLGLPVYSFAGSTYLTDPYGNLVLDPYGEPIPLP